MISTPVEISKAFSKLWLGSIWNTKKLLERNPGVGLMLNCTDEVVPRVLGVHVLPLGLRDGEEMPSSKRSTRFASPMSICGEPRRYGLRPVGFTRAQFNSGQSSQCGVSNIRASR